MLDVVSDQTKLLPLDVGEWKNLVVILEQNYPFRGNLSD
jgi:hypothetical protein